MKPKDLQKMCSQCDGRIPIDATECPYCGTEQTLESKFSAKAEPMSHHQSLNDSLSSLYAPPYSAKNTSSFMEEKKDFTLKKPSYTQEYSPTAQPTPPIKTEAEEETETAKSTFWPILLLSIGTNLLLIGLLQLFFSDNGRLTLEWDSSYWFLYCLISLPLFYFGIKKVNSLK